MFVDAAERYKGQYVQFAIVNLLALVQVWLISVGLLQLVFGHRLWMTSGNLAHGIGVVSPILTSYFAPQNATRSEPDGQDLAGWKSTQTPL